MAKKSTVVMVNVKEAREHKGPGTNIMWRPNIFEGPFIDNDPALLIHVSTEEDKHFAKKSLEREALTSRL